MKESTFYSQLDAKTGIQAVLLLNYIFLGEASNAGMITSYVKC